MFVSPFCNLPFNSSKDEKPKADDDPLDSFALTDEIWSIHRISVEILPCLLEHYRKITDHHPFKRLEEVDNTIRKLKDVEKLVNQEVRALIVPKLYDIQLGEEELSLGGGRSHLGFKLEEMLKVQPFEDAQEAVDGEHEVPMLTFERIQRISLFSEVRKRYDCLDVRSKLCLLFLSVFPDNFHVRERDLRLWWIGEELIPKNMGAEEFVRKMFLKFAEMNFVEPVMQKKRVKKYKMHPILRRSLNILARNDQVFNIDYEGNFVVGSKLPSHALLIRTNMRSSQYALRNRDPKTLRTIFNVNESFIDLQSLWLSKAKKLRILHLGSWQGSNKSYEVANTEFLRRLVKLKCLRYLSLRRVSGIYELPSSMSQLQDLRILDLKACQELTKVPPEIGKLTMLTHLDMSECYLIESIPKEIGLLKELQVLKGFVIGNRQTEGGVCTIHDLKNLKKLRKLSIYGNMEEPDDDEQFSGISVLAALRSLTITWVEGANLSKQVSSKRNLLTEQPKELLKRMKRIGSDARIRRGVLTKHHPLPLLEKLDLRCFPGTKLPSWIHPSEMKALKNLSIRGGQLCRLDVVEHGEWKEVEVLRLKYLANLKVNWEQVNQLFPHLNYLEKFGCPKIQLFPCDRSGIWTKEG